jgi:hypothetical protein
MVRSSSGNDFKPFFVAPEMVVMFCQFHRGFHRFRSIAEEGEAIDLSRGDLGDHFGKFEGRAIDKLHRSEITEFADLVIDRLGDLFPSITDMNGAGHPCDEVEIAIPILVIDPDTFPSGDHGDSLFQLVSWGSLHDEVGIQIHLYFFGHGFTPSYDLSNL